MICPSACPLLQSRISAARATAAASAASRSPAGLTGAHAKRLGERSVRWSSGRAFIVARQRWDVDGAGAAVLEPEVHAPGLAGVPETRCQRDSLMAATALVRRLIVVTRDVRNFEPMGLKLLNSWSVE
ncbi:hypothetical protein ACFPMG_22810 [Azospirillum himalayense]|uniref:Type II toxin-antitoxin system VapC family toxin n=1 Tax=Azospirillum himalayense TaxID=654847 RepID=A0ABW0GA21_9PROT